MTFFTIAATKILCLYIGTLLARSLKVIRDALKTRLGGKEALSLTLYLFTEDDPKIDRCLRNRIKEHTTDKNSEVYKHINSCQHF